MSMDDNIIQRVWEKGQVVSNNDPNEWRKDDCDAWMERNQYGNRDSQYGWEVDHIKHLSHGGSNDLGNLRPLQWQNNAHRSDGRLTCVVTASGTSNVTKQ